MKNIPGYRQPAMEIRTLIKKRRTGAPDSARNARRLAKRQVTRAAQQRQEDERVRSLEEPPQLCEACGGAGVVERAVYANDIAVGTFQPAATRVVCWKCAGSGMCEPSATVAERTLWDF